MKGFKFSARTLELTCTEDMHLYTILFHALSHLIDLYVLASKYSDSVAINDYSYDLVGTISFMNRFYPDFVVKFRSIFEQEYPEFPYDTFFVKGGEADEK